MFGGIRIRRRVSFRFRWAAGGDPAARYPAHHPAHHPADSQAHPSAHHAGHLQVSCMTNYLFKMAFLEYLFFYVRKILCAKGPYIRLIKHFGS